MGCRSRPILHSPRLRLELAGPHPRRLSLSFLRAVSPSRSHDTTRPSRAPSVEGLSSLIISTLDDPNRREISQRPATQQPGRRIMLELRPNCECCNRDLPPDAQDALICSFECTFCGDCADTKLGGRCLNCGGEFQPRPVRPSGKLEKFPASSKRILKADACSAA